MDQDLLPEGMTSRRWAATSANTRQRKSTGPKRSVALGRQLPGAVNMKPGTTSSTYSRRLRWSQLTTDEYHKQSFTMDGPMPCIILIDGFTNGTWKIDRQRRTAILNIKPFRRLSKKETAALTEEGTKLLAFAAADADTHDFQFTPHV